MEHLVPIGRIDDGCFSREVFEIKKTQYGYLLKIRFAGGFCWIKPLHNDHITLFLPNSFIINDNPYEIMGE